MRAFSIAFALFIAFGVAFVQDGAKAPPKPIVATVAEIADEPAKFDKKLVKASGIVKNLRLRTSKAGNDYTTFDLTEKDDKVHVYSRGKLEIKEGDRVVVTARFYTEKKLGELTFKNEMDASPTEGGKVTKEAK